MWYIWIQSWSKGEILIPSKLRFPYWHQLHRNHERLFLLISHHHQTMLRLLSLPRANFYNFRHFWPRHSILQVTPRRERRTLHLLYQRSRRPFHSLTQRDPDAQRSRWSRENRLIFGQAHNHLLCGFQEEYANLNVSRSSNELVLANTSEVWGQSHGILSTWML